MIPLVGRRVEAVHSELKRIGQAARNVTPPFISARLSEPQHLVRLSASIEFRDFVIRKWHSTQTLNQVLKLVLPPDRLMSMSRHQKIDAIYQCDLDSEFRDVSVQQAARQQWLLHTSHTRRQASRLPQLWSLTVSYLQAKFVRHVVFSLPTALFDLSAILPVDGDLDYNRASPWDEMIAIGASEPKQFNFALSHTTTFFEVVNAAPQNRQNVAVHYADDWLDQVHVLQRTLHSSDVASRRVVLLSTSDSHKVLHLRVFVNLLASYLPNLFMWKHVAYGESKAVRRNTRPEVLQDDLAPLMPISLSGGGHSIAVGGSASSSHHRMTSDVVATDVLAQMDLVQSRQDLPQAVPFSEMRGIHLDNVASMVEDGALVVETSEFGELFLAQREAGIRYISLQLVSDPVQMIMADVCTCTSKLDLVLWLLRHGWVAGDVLAPYAQGDDRIFACSSFRPTSYFTCLVRSDDLFARGIVSVPHDAKDLVYQAMLRLDGDALADFLSCLARNVLDERWLRGQLKGKGLAIVDPGEGGEGGDVGAEDPSVEALSVQPLIPLQLDYSTFLWKRAKVSSNGSLVHKVIMDHCTSASGQQRGYINCLVPHHHNCFLWRNCSAYPNRPDMLADMLAWALAGSRYADRYDHMANVPDVASVAQVKDSMVVEDF